MTDDSGIERLLAEIRDNQKIQLERQQEALILQREQAALVQRQFERTTALQDRAEQLQNRSAAMVGLARRTLIVIIPVVALLVLYVSWLMLFRR